MRLSAVLFGLALPVIVFAGQASLPLQRFFEDIAGHKDDLARYRYLVTAMPRLAPGDAPIGQQFIAFAENELGLYGEAVRDFPMRSILPEHLELPRPPEWQAVDAVQAIATLAADRRIVMINEAHHDAHSRLLTLALLPRLRTLGFTHFAVEALDERDTSLMQRGYPVMASGSEYLHEPIYGELVREAIRLGFVVVPYDQTGRTMQDRERLQARRLAQVFADHPEARLFVHAGYAHIDKASGRLGKVQPMAMLLKSMSGLDVLSIDQTDIREEDPRNEREAYFSVLDARHDGTPIAASQASPVVDPHLPDHSPYRQLTKTYQPKTAIVLRRIKGGTFWSARPEVYDMNVLLPPANEHVANYVQHGLVNLPIDGHRYAFLSSAAGGHRPDWLSLDGRRVPVPIDAAGCNDAFPCLVEALYAQEADDAVAADRYLFLEEGHNVLYLKPGAYRLRRFDVDGHLLQNSPIEARAGMR